MSAQHTPGRALLDDFDPIVRGEDGHRIATCYRLIDGDPNKTPEETGQANARRLAACWNLLEAVPTEQIEGSAKVTELCKKLLAQRDELLQVLEHALAWNDDAEPTPSWVFEARAAIAKAEG